MFTKAEAVAFLQNSWDIQKVEERLKNDRKRLIEEVVIQIQSRVPFQNITLMAAPLEQRRRPNVKDIKQACMKGVGGLCYSLNVFTWGLLQGLGLHVQLCPATCTTSVTYPNNHLFVLVRDLEANGDLHLIECGVGVPTFQVVSLNFDHESPVFKDSYLEYKFIRHDGQILRMHGDGDTMKRNDPPKEGLDFYIGKWRRMYYFTVKPTECLSDFDTIFDEVFTVPGRTPFHHSPRAIWFPGQRAILFVNNRSLVEEDKGQLKLTVMENDGQTLDFFCCNFPTIDQEDVLKAIIEWHHVSE